MKKSRIYPQVLLALILLFIAACQKEKIMKYDSKDSVYFYNTNANKSVFDSIVYTFKDHGNVTKDTITVRIKLIGKFTNYDRMVNVVIDSTTATEGTDFKVLTPVKIQKDSGYVSVKVVLYRTTGLKTAAKAIWLGLHNSSDLNAANYPGHTSFKIKFSDRLEKPSWWDDYIGYMWPYSETRMLFYISVMGSTDNYFDSDYTGTLYKLKLATAEYNLTHTTPLSDEYGLISWDVSWVDQ